MSNSELLDIIDEKDNVIGQATREECHSNPNLLHHTAHFTLIDKTHKKILLTQRSLTKKYDAGKYCFLGEHILSGETNEEALIRGVKEEINVEITKYKEVCKHIFHYQKESELVKFYICDYKYQALDFDKNEVEQYMFVNISDLKTLNLDISEMTQYWINNTNWEKILLTTNN